MNIDVHHSDHVSKLILQGRFDFTSHRSFKQAYELALNESATRELQLDLSAVDYLDSSALGMLLILRDRSKEMHKQVSLTNCGTSVREVLHIANFEKLFNVS